MSAAREEHRRPVGEQHAQGCEDRPSGQTPQRPHDHESGDSGCDAHHRRRSRRRDTPRRQQSQRQDGGTLHEPFIHPTGCDPFRRLSGLAAHAGLLRGDTEHTGLTQGHDSSDSAGLANHAARCTNDARVTP